MAGEVTLTAEIALRAGELDLEAVFDVSAGEVVGIVGPNGAGKTTLLRALAGLLRIARGRIALDEQVLEDPERGIFVSTRERRVGFVFQDYALFPHLTVLENVAFGLRSRSFGRRAARRRAASWLTDAGLGHYLHEKPRALSGGQAQRVALARALVTDPKMLLLDEPLAALDALARVEVRRDLERHLSSFPGPVLLVTHDPIEAMALADRLIVFEDGNIVQMGSPDDLRLHPRSSYAANLAGVNLFRGDAAGVNIRLRGGGAITASTPSTGSVYAAVDPRSVALFRSRPEGTPRNVWPLRIAAIDSDEERSRIALEGEVSLVAQVTPDAVAALQLRPGEKVWAAVKASEIAVYPS